MHEASSLVPRRFLLASLPRKAQGTEFWTHRPPSGFAPLNLGCSDPGKTVTVKVTRTAGGSGAIQ